MMRKKLIIYYISLVLLITFLLSANSKANSPSSMNLEYNQSTEVLSVSITHTVSDPATHFIVSVTIRVNSVTVNTSSYTSQPTSSSFTYVYNNISANTGDTIEVTAVCNIAGSIARSLQVNGGTNEPIIPGFVGIVLVLIISATILMGFNYRKIRH